MFILFALLFIGLLFLLPKPKTENKQAAGFGEIQINTTSADRAIPYLAGKDLLKGGNVFWYGDYSTQPITTEIDFLFGLFSQEIVVGHKYFLGVALGLFYGDDYTTSPPTIHEIRIGGKVAWTGTLTHGQTITINEPALFGDPKSEGGVSGNVTFYAGRSDQDADPYLTGQLTEVPAYRGLAYLVFESFYWGNTQNIPMVDVVASRYPRANPAVTAYLRPNSGAGDDANGIDTIYEILTNPRFSVGIPEASLNYTAFYNASVTIFNEDLGTTFSNDRAMTGEDLIEQISRHLNCAVYTNPVTGLIDIMLIRDDYTVGTIPELSDDTGLKEVRDFSRGGIETVPSELRVKFIDRDENYTANIAQANNVAARHRRGKPTPGSIQYMGARQSGIAATLAWRDMTTMSTSLAHFKLVADRRAYTYHRGTVFLLNTAKYEIAGMVCRVVGIDYGELDNNQIILNVVEDVFYAGSAVFGDNPGSSNPPLHSNPLDVTVFRAFELPLFGINISGLTPAAMCFFAHAPTGDHLKFDLLTTPAGSSTYRDDIISKAFARYSTLNADYLGNANSLQLSTVMDELTAHTLAEAEASGFNFALITNGVDVEFIVFTGVTHTATNTTLTGVYRGMLDTTPKSWAAGAYVYPLNWMAISLYDYATSGTMNFKFITYTSKGVLDPASATQRSHALANRVAKCYPARYLRVNGLHFPSAYVTGELVFNWYESNKDTDDFVLQTDGTMTPPVNTAYNIYFYDANHNLLYSVAGLTSPTYTYTLAQESAGNATIDYVKLRTLENGAASFDEYKMGVPRYNLGFRLGEALGGTV